MTFSISEVHTAQQAVLYLLAAANEDMTSWIDSLSLSTFPADASWEDPQVQNHPALADERWKWPDWDALTGDLTKAEDLLALTRQITDDALVLERRALERSVQTVQRFVACVGSCTDAFCA